MGYAEVSKALLTCRCSSEKQESTDLVPMCSSNADCVLSHSYFRQRHKIFSKYDEGVWMTEDAWYGVTHEAVAKYDFTICHSQVRAFRSFLTMTTEK